MEKGAGKREKRGGRVRQTSRQNEKEKIEREGQRRKVRRGREKGIAAATT